MTEHFDLQRPVVIGGALDHWPAYGRQDASRWWGNLDYLKRVAGRRSVPVELGSHYLADGWTQKIMTVAEFIEQHLEDKEEAASSVDGGAVGYLAQHELLEQIPALKRDIIPPDYVGLGDTGEVRTNAWLGPRGTVSPLHTDPTHNLLCQVVGSKYIRLYDPQYTEHLYPHESKSMVKNSSQVDAEAPDNAKFPLFAEAPYTECVLEEGDCLYIPPGWWHYVRSLSRSFSVSFWFE
jgi:lysine-specific demethylase 8